MLKKLEQQKYLDPVSVSNKRTDATEIEITENKNVGLGFRVVNVIRKSRAPKVAVKTEMFLPGRSSYVFNVSRILVSKYLGKSALGQMEMTGELNLFSLALIFIHTDIR